MKRLTLSALTSALLGASIAVSAQTLSIGFADPVSSMDPQLNNHAGDRSVAMHFFEQGVTNTRNTLVPTLFESWKPLDDKTWEFKVRKGIKWQDGVEFTADDLIFSYTRARAVPGSVATYAGHLRTVESLNAPDPYTLIVKTNVPNPDMPLNFASVHVVSKHVGETATTADYNSGKAMVGNGPYKFVSYTPGDRIVMERNDTYFGDKAQWQRVNYRYINNAAARTAALLAGDVDVIDKVSVADLARLEKAPNISVYPYNGLRVLLLQPSFNPAPSPFITDNADKALDKNPLLDVRVRQALNLAINRKTIISRVVQGAATEANQWMPAGTIGYNPDIKDIAYDPDQARKLLAEAGFPDGFKLTMHVPNDRYPQGPETAQAVAQFWTRVGVKTQVEVVPWAVYSGRTRKNEFAVSMLGWGNGTGEASYAMVNILATVDPKRGLGASNWGHYSSSQFDALLAASASEFDVPKRQALMRDAAKVVSDDAGIIPLYHYKNIWAAKKGLKVEPITSDRTAAMMVTRVE